MESLHNKIIRSIRGHGSGWSFSQKDFLQLGSREAIDIALHRLTNTGNIRRVIRGIYDYPKYSKLLKENLSPDIHQVAHAIARKNGWRLQKSGEEALNELGISTQVPGAVIYLTDGPSKEYDIGKVNIKFKKTPLKEMQVKHKPTAMAVQALKVSRSQDISDKIISTIRKNRKPEELSKMRKDAQYVTGRVYKCIEKICSKEIK
ncbi:DUF6088 family protein [Lentisphaerota bacterium ZTH]|nr:hypothetical protein JYG24_09950 [Lentisphaerota bacterium]WET06185.1 DUF6088 family protein [Lentisphaerota bacterium ZTH]